MQAQFLSPSSQFRILYPHLSVTSHPKPQSFDYLVNYFDFEIKHNQLTLHCSDTAGILIKIIKENNLPDSQ